jgi:hypothetical protein
VGVAPIDACHIVGEDDTRTLFQLAEDRQHSNGIFGAIPSYSIILRQRGFVQVRSG